MAKSFQVPDFYRSDIIATVKRYRQAQDPRKKDLSPTILDFGAIRVKLARHFGFCYGVENAVDIAYKALSENKDRRIFLLSEMIHNPNVNEDLQGRGIRFLRDTAGNTLIPLTELTPEDVVIIPAFGAAIEVEQELQNIGLDIERYNAVCPFVEKVWKKSEQIGTKDFTIVIHGKRFHEETRATFSRAYQHAPTVVVKNLKEAQDLADVIAGKKSKEFFFERFAQRFSDGFHPETDLKTIGVVNQTTMLASETQAIADLLKQSIVQKYGEAAFADTRDTLCYATNENQNATHTLIEEGADFAVVVGGYNSSNTSHLVELCSKKMPTFFIKDADEVLSLTRLNHFVWERQQRMLAVNWFPKDLIGKRPIDMILTAGASCPDSLLEQVMLKIFSLLPPESLHSVEEVVAKLEHA